MIAAFVVLKPGVEPAPDLERELRATVRDVLGPVAVIGEVHVVSSTSTPSVAARATSSAGASLPSDSVECEWRSTVDGGT